MPVIEPVLRFLDIAADEIVVQKQFVEAPVAAQHLGHPAGKGAHAGVTLEYAVEVRLLMVIKVGEIGQRQP